MSNQISRYKYPNLWGRRCNGAWCASTDPMPMSLRLTDQSGRQNHGVLTDMTPDTDWVTSNGKQSLTFSGSKVVNFGIIPASRYVTASTFSVSLWINPVFKLGILQNIFGCRDAGGYSWTLRLNGLQIGLLTNGSSNFSASVAVIGEWQHICLLYDAGSINLLQNGKSIATASGHSLSATRNLYMGNIGGGGQAFSGLIDDARVFDGLISNSEISLLKTRKGIAYETNNTRLTRFVTSSSVVTGSVSGSLPLTGSSVGIVLVKASTSGSISLTGSSTANIRVQGTGSGSLALSGSVSGTVSIQGTASGSLPLTGSASGITNNGRTGSAEGSLALSGSSTGKIAINATGSGNLSLSGNATGSVLIRGSASGVISISGTAVIGEPYTVYVSPIDLEFIQMAEELFADFVPEPNATYKYINADNAANPATPWDVTFGTSIDYPVKLIVYPSEIEGRRFSKYREGTEVPTGAIKVLMKKESFEPKQKDFVELRGKLYKVTSIDPIAPLYQSICHILTLGV